MLLTPMPASADGQQAQRAPTWEQVGTDVPFLQTRGYETGYERSFAAGRSRVVASSTVAGLIGGLELWDALQIDDVRLGAATILGTTTAGFLTSYMAVKDAKITEGMADAYDLGLVLGALNGGLLGAASTDDERTVSGATVAGMTLGGVAGIALGKQLNPTRGQVGFIGLTSKLGMATAAFGLGLGNQEMDSDNAMGALVAGMDIGAVAGMAIAPRIEWSLARVRWVGVGSLLGAVAGWSAAAIIAGGEVTELDGKQEIQDNTHQAMAAGALLGMWTGFGVAAKATSDMPTDQRFRKGKKTIVAPTPVDGGLGLSLSGVF